MAQHRLVQHQLCLVTCSYKIIPYHLVMSGRPSSFHLHRMFHSLQALASVFHSAYILATRARAVNKTPSWFTHSGLDDLLVWLNY